MRYKIAKQFLRDLKNIDDKSIRVSVVKIVEKMENANNISDIHFIKLRGFDSFYKKRIRNYRIGIILEKDTVLFCRVLHRQNIYKKFPKNEI
jgi:mRNA interferase RelE/StbE